MAESKNYAYPLGISQVPYASFIKINKYKYDKGMKEVAQNQADALGSVSNSGALRGVADAVTNSANYVYNEGTKSNKYANISASKDNTATGWAAAVQKARKDTQWWGTGVFDRRSDDDILNTEFEGKYIGGKRSKVKLKDTIARKEEVRKYNAEGYKMEYCNLPLPNEFQYNYGANWNNTFKLGTMALLADDPGRAKTILGAGGVLGGTLGGLKNALGDVDASKSTKKWVGIATGAAKGAKIASNPFNVNSDLLDPTNLAGLAGMAPNENAIQFFSKMEFRQFELNFEFASRDDKESKVIQDILKWFKVGMHPGSLDALGSGTGVLLGFPDVFVLEPRFVPVEKGKELPSEPHKMMPKTKLCALTSMSVNTTPFGALTTVHDGTIPLITVTLRFNELTALTKMDFESQLF